MGRSNSHKSAKDSFIFKSESHLFRKLPKRPELSKCVESAHFENEACSFSKQLETSKHGKCLSLCVCLCICLSLCVWDPVHTPNTTQVQLQDSIDCTSTPLCVCLISGLYTSVRVSECMLSKCTKQSCDAQLGRASNNHTMRARLDQQARRMSFEGGGLVNHGFRTDNWSTS